VRLKAEIIRNAKAWILMGLGALGVAEIGTSEFFNKNGKLASLHGDSELAGDRIHASGVGKFMRWTTQEKCAGAI
jgi:hypothetical protein